MYKNPPNIRNYILSGPTLVVGQETLLVVRFYGNLSTAKYGFNAVTISSFTSQGLAFGTSLLLPIVI